MSERSKREQAYATAASLFNWVAGGSPGPDLGGVIALVNLIIDAAKEELRAEMDSLDEEILREMHRRHGKPPAGDGEDSP